MKPEDKRQACEVMRELAPAIKEYLQDELGYSMDFSLILWDREGEDDGKTGVFVSTLNRKGSLRRFTRLARQLAYRAATAMFHGEHQRVQ